MNLERIEALLKLLQRQAHVGTLSVEGDGWRLQARRGEYVSMPPVDEAPVEEASAGAAEPQAVLAVAVGIYRAPASPVRVGDHIAEGTALGNIDSMRILNAVTAEHSGYVTEVRVEDGDAVEYGQELFSLGPEPPAEETAL